jgi:hypothetical protein
VSKEKILAKKTEQKLVEDNTGGAKLKQRRKSVTIHD